MATVVENVAVPADFTGPVASDPRCPYYHLVPKDHEGQLEFRRRMIQFGAQSKKNALALGQMCARDILFYINVFVMTYNPRLRDSPAVLFNTYPYQDKFILDMADAIGIEDLLVEKSRDMGASWICLMVFEWYFHFKERLTFLLVSRKEDLVDKTNDPDSLMWKLDFVHENLPTWMKPNGASGLKRSKLSMYNPRTGSSIDGTSTTGDIARGGRRTAILLDEFASVDDGDDVLKATRDASDCRIFNSTPKGRGNAFADLIEKRDIVIFRFHWYLHPVKSKDAYYKAKVSETDASGRYIYSGEERRVDGLQRPNRSPWYNLQCKRARNITEIAQELDIDYSGSDYQFFNSEDINRCIVEFARPAMWQGTVSVNWQTAEVISLERKPFGHLRLWCQVDMNGRPVLGQFDEYVIGADISTGRNASNSVLSIGHKATGEKVGEFAQADNIPEHKFAVFAVALAKMFGNLNPNHRRGALLIWEANGPGLTFGTCVVDDWGYREIYYRKAESQLVHKRSNQPGWFSTLDTKQRLLGEYKKSLGNGFINRSTEALKECKEYIYDGNSISHVKSLSTDDPSGAKANHGDRVIADALCWKGIKETREAPLPPPPMDAPLDSFGGRRDEWERSQKRKKFYC